MMPHTVPNRPMYGVMLAVVARNVTRLLELVHFDADARSSARSSAGEALESRTRRGAAPDWIGAGAGARSCAVSSA